MARLPTPGGDHGNWGDILNDYLAQSHASDGLLRSDSVGSAQLQTNAVTADAIAPNSITNAAIASDAINAASIADGSITNVLIADDTIQEAKLSSSVQLKLNQSAPVTSVAGKTGVVTLDKSDVGLGNVDNTSDATKNTATATLTNKTLTSPRINAVLDATNGGTAFSFSGVANATNSLYAGNTATGGTPHIKAQGSDANINVTVSSKGTGAVRLQDGNWVNIIQAQGVTNAANYVNVVNAAAGAGPTMAVAGTDTNINLNLGGKGTGVVQANGIEVATVSGAQTLSNKTLNNPRVNALLDPGGATAFAITSVPSAVNYLQVQGGTGVNAPAMSALGTATNLDVAIGPKGTGNLVIYTGTGVTPTLRANGPDTDHSLNLVAKGAGTVRANGIEVATVSGVQTLTNKTLSSPRVSILQDTGGAISLNLPAVASAVNYVTIYNAVTSSTPTIGASGSDANVGLNLTSKGTGTVRANGAEIVTISATQTLTSKTLTSPQIDGSAVMPTAASLSAYNTSDQTTNYERIRHFWSSNVYSITSESGGTGATRVIELKSGGVLRINTSGTNGLIQMSSNTTAASGIGLALTGVYSSATSAVGISIAPTINQTGSATYTALFVNPTETSTGTGVKLLADFRVGGDSKFRVDNTGKVMTKADSVNIATAKTPASANATGTTGDIAWDSDYVYVCVATDTWKRSSLGSW